VVVTLLALPSLWSRRRRRKRRKRAIGAGAGAGAGGGWLSPPTLAIYCT